MTYVSGDKAIINHDHPCSAQLMKGDMVIVLDINNIGGYTVRKIGSFHKWEVDPTCLDAYVELPVGQQMTLEDMESNKCDCGGYAVYKSMEPQYHSASLPCSSLNAKS